MLAPVKNAPVRHAVKPPPTVREGARGATVEKLQKLLHRGGANPGAVDGIFGPLTRAAVKSFQKHHGLTATGVVNGDTWEQLQPKANRLGAAASPSKQSPVFQIGDTHAAIERAEKNLARLGYDPGTVDRHMDEETAAAIKAFRADEGSKVKTGNMHESVRQALGEAVKKLAHSSYHSRVKPSKEHRRLDSATAQAAGKTFDGKLGIGEGMNGKTRAAKNVQLRLKAAGYDPARTDGVFDERTAGAVKAFQRRSGLMPTGRVDTGTWKKLKDAYVYGKSGTSPAQTVGERSSAVKRSEKVLRELGYKSVKADGTYDSKTAKAVRHFEKKHHLTVNGALSTNDLKAMKKTLARRSTKTVAGCANILLRSKNVSFWTGLSSGSDRKNLELLAKGKQAFVPATGGHVKPKLKMMQALVAMSRRGPIMINALTGGQHSTGSNHYSGTAVDLDLSTGNASMIARIARKYGGLRNFETDHIHLDF